MLLIQVVCLWSQVAGFPSRTYHYVAEQKLPSPQSKYQSKQGGGRGEVGAALTPLSLPSHWLLRAAPKSHLLCSPWELEEETEVHWNFKSLFEAGLEMRSHSSVPKAQQQTRISMQSTQLLICLCLGSMPGSASVPASALPVLSQGKIQVD